MNIISRTTIAARITAALAGLAIGASACSPTASDEATGTQNAALGSTVTPDEIAALAKGAGLPCDKLVVATAVALGESDGVVRATHYNAYDGSTDRGIWQINSKAWPMFGESCVFDAACNAKAMATISNKGASFSHWLAYTNGRYQQFMSQAQAAYGRGVAGCAAGGGGGGGVASPPGGAASCVSLGYSGKCYGSTLVWLETNGECRVVDCSTTKRACRFDGALGYNCK